MKYFLAIFPSAGVLLLFWLAMKALFEGDRRERAAEAQFDRERATAEAAVTESGDQD